LVPTSLGAQKGWCYPLISQGTVEGTKVKVKTSIGTEYRIEAQPLGVNYHQGITATAF
jgi:hypothetical protein